MIKVLNSKLKNLWEYQNTSLFLFFFCFCFCFCYFFCFLFFLFLLFSNFTKIDTKGAFLVKKTCLVRLRFKRYFSHYLSKCSLIKHTCSQREKLVILWILNKQVKISLRILSKSLMVRELLKRYIKKGCKRQIKQSLGLKKEVINSIFHGRVWIIDLIVELIRKIIIKMR